MPLFTNESVTYAEGFSYLINRPEAGVWIPLASLAWREEREYSTRITPQVSGRFGVEA